jgi:hypothetical protein
MVRAGRITLRVDQGAANRIAADHAYELVTDVTRQTFNRANVLTPVRTGNLRAHNRMTARREAPGARGWVFNDASYAPPVHDGSGPYTIRPRRRQALRFEIGGRVVFAKSVRHPGTRARPWLARAGREVAAANGFSWTPG